MIITDHSADSTQNFLRKVMSATKRIIPRCKGSKQAEVDSSWALLQGATLAFNRTTVENYLHEAWLFACKRQRRLASLYNTYMCGPHDPPAGHQAEGNRREREGIQKIRAILLCTSAQLQYNGRGRQNLRLHVHCLRPEALTNEVKVAVKTLDKHIQSSEEHGLEVARDEEQLQELTDAASDNPKDYGTLSERSRFYQHFKRIHDQRLSHAGNQEDRDKEGLKDNP